MRPAMTLPEKLSAHSLRTLSAATLQRSTFSFCFISPSPLARFVRGAFTIVSLDGILLSTFVLYSRSLWRFLFCCFPSTYCWTYGGVRGQGGMTVPK
jgi:hypothetical protein